MSKVFNMVGGGGKNISSIIITRLKSTDTVTCTKDGKSYTATWDDTAQYWEIVGLPLGTFTVTATNGTDITTETVVIDIAGVYEIEMTFKLWLYKNGDECEDVTGGWGVSGWVYSGGSFTPISFTKNDTSIYMNNNTSSSIIPSIATNNKISLSGYSKMCFEINVDTVYGAGSRIEFTNIKDMDSNTSGVDVKTNVNKTGNNVFSIDLDGTEAEKYVCIVSWTRYYSIGNITRIWLER